MTLPVKGKSEGVLKRFKGYDSQRITRKKSETEARRAEAYERNRIRKIEKGMEI